MLGRLRVICALRSFVKKVLLLTTTYSGLSITGTIIVWPSTLLSNSPTQLTDQIVYQETCKRIKIKSSGFPPTVLIPCFSALTANGEENLRKEEHLVKLVSTRLVAIRTPHREKGGEQSKPTS